MGLILLLVERFVKKKSRMQKMIKCNENVGMNCNVDDVEHELSLNVIVGGFINAELWRNIVGNNLNAL